MLRRHFPQVGSSDPEAGQGQPRGDEVTTEPHPVNCRSQSCGWPSLERAKSSGQDKDTDCEVQRKRSKDDVPSKRKCMASNNKKAVKCNQMSTIEGEREP